MARKEIRQAIADYLRTELGANVQAVYEGQPSFNISLFPAIVVFIPTSERTRKTASRPVGRKKIEYTIVLHVLLIRSGEDVFNVYNTFDDLLDLIQDKLEEYPVSDEGTIVEIARDFIRVRHEPPDMIGESTGTVFHQATIEVDVYSFKTG